VTLVESQAGRIFDGIRCVMGGRYPVDRKSFSDSVWALRTVGSPVDASAPSRGFGLSLCEIEVVALLVAGYSNAAARRCSISGQTVTHPLGNAFDKLVYGTAWRWRSSASATA
jgi:DNA-binding NarL/FixJ family response regulator